MINRNDFIIKLHAETRLSNYDSEKLVDMIIKYSSLDKAWPIYRFEGLEQLINHVIEIKLNTKIDNYKGVDCNK